MHGYAIDVTLPEFDLSSMEAAAHLDPKRVQSPDNCGSAADSPSRTVEGGKETVACRFDLSSAEARQFVAHRLIMSPQQNAPVPVAEGGGALS
jgi:hypothetical protein